MYIQPGGDKHVYIQPGGEVLHLQEGGSEAAAVEEQRGAAGKEGEEPAGVTIAKGNAVVRCGRGQDGDGDSGRR